ncbi:hypothetical protein PV08_03508 [Exophiala spinifera]|uniref:Zn(2)-C6 fungal-type domain-containing protein n=1 Tax=Exophiala spinifera TaxID=91928 RepID=A0A0D2C6K9_9EURO|nr:uncharacterized protein PV08_03508 [Exophiala spinifera]KIW19214.1 hypothetical protein PV08_03508 [Exophiala spinifera]
MSMDGYYDFPDTKAPQACVACRKQKRKCDKVLPTCSLCARMARTCDYSESTPLPSAEDFARMKQKMADLEARLEGRRSDGGWHQPFKSVSRSPSSGLESASAGGGGGGVSISAAAAAADSNAARFPAMFFLDAEVYESSGQSAVAQKPTVPIPPEVLAMLGSSILDIQDIVGRYFENIHTWLPFISRKRMELTLTNPGLEMTFDLALLLLCMKLITLGPLPMGFGGGGDGVQQHTRGPLYTLAKRTLYLAESHGLICLRTLQANILVAAYEIGHAIYPAAYLTTGHCARLGHALGLNDRRRAPQIYKKKAGAWAEVEEMKRTWWATMLLDRYVNLGSYGHPLATDDPGRGETLPADDVLWDDGELTGSEPLYVSSSTNIKAGAFARTCQACHLLGRLLRLLNDQMLSDEGVIGPGMDVSMGMGMRFAEALQLHRTFRALANLLMTEHGDGEDEGQRRPGAPPPPPPPPSQQHYGTALALCLGGLLHLYDPFACTETNHGTGTVEETEMQTVAIAGLRAVAADVLRFSRGALQASMRDHPAAISPLVGDCLYIAAATYAWLAYETGSRDAADAYHQLRNVLGIMATRWAVAGQYLATLEKARETLYPETPLLLSRSHSLSH